MNKEIGNWLNLALSHFNIEEPAEMDGYLVDLSNEEYSQYVLDLREDLRERGLDTPTKNSIIGFVNWRRVQLTLSQES